MSNHIHLKVFSVITYPCSNEGLYACDAHELPLSRDTSVLYFTEEVKPHLTKPHLIFNGGLAKTSLVKQTLWVPLIIYAITSKEIWLIAVAFGAWVGNCIHRKLLGVITTPCSNSIIVSRCYSWFPLPSIYSDKQVGVTIYPCPNFSGGLNKPPLNLGHGWVITSCM